MAMNLYVGLQRSGKSYEVVSNVILPAIESGRDVVSNIAGLNEQAMYDLLIAEGKDPSTFGRLKPVTADQVNASAFFRTDKMDQPEESFVQAGDLVALDEIWRFWPLDKKVPEDHLNFFRMHGHFVNPDNGLTCEIVLITQSVADVHRQVKATIMQTVEMTKNTEVGSDNSYIVRVYSRTDTRKRPINTFGPYRYNSKYFPLYQTHSKNDSGVQGREVRVEKRNSIFNGRFFRFGMPLAVFLFIGGLWGAYRFFNQDFSKQGQTVAETEQNAQQDIKRGIPAAGTQQQSQNVSTSGAWRVAGHVTVGGLSRVLLVNSDGRSRYLIPASITSYGTDFKAVVHGKEHNSWDYSDGKSLLSQ